MSETSQESVSIWIEEMKDGDDDAAAKLWERYFEPLIQRAARRLNNSRAGRVVSPEDAVVDVFTSLFERLRQGKYPDLLDRHGLWRLLLTITDRKCSNLVRREKAISRGGGNVRGDSIGLLPGSDSAAGAGGLDKFEGCGLTPDADVAVSETLANLIGLLREYEAQFKKDLGLTRIALLKMDGFTNKEISAELACAVATVERRLKVIRDIWQEWDPRPNASS